MSDDDQPANYQKLRELGGVIRARSADPKAPQPKPGKAPEDVIYLKLDRAVVRQFKALCAEEGRQQKHMAGEALNWLFKKYGKNRIADAGPNAPTGEDD